MKKITTSLLVLALGLFSFNASAQYYYNSFPNVGANPGGLNTDPEQPFGAAGVTAANGYTAVIANGQTTLQWSPNQTLPFSFSFNGSPVTSYKVSNSGVLTFTTSATTVPSFTNATIPNASIPDNSVMIWGLQQSVGSTNDGVISKTHGTSPNRQHWVTFASFSAPGATGSQWTYWSIVLEETTNKIYLVDQRNYLTPVSLTLGVQVNSTTAYQAAGSPNIVSNTTNGGSVSDPSDNSYWEFIQGTRPADDAELTSLGMNAVESNSSPIAITGTITNKGTSTLTSVQVHWTADGGVTVNSDTITMNLATLSAVGFSHNINWTPAAGSSYTIDVWTSSPNGNLDGNTLNDSLSQSVFVNIGSTVTRNVLFEEFTTAVCQFCPDGHVIQDQIVAAIPTVIPVGVHACFNTDAMTVAEASTLCSTLGPNSAPSGMIDRVLYPGESRVGHGRGGNVWPTRSASRTALGSPLDITFSGSYNPGNRLLNLDVISSFVDYVPSGNIRVSLMIIEDSMSGTGTGWAQYNAYYAVNGHPFFGIGTPFAPPNNTISYINNYQHRHVLRDILPATWGDGSVVPSSPAINTNYTKNFLHQISTSRDPNQVYLVAVVHYYGNTNQDGYEVINAKQIKLTDLIVTGINEETALNSSLKIYPNPTDLPYTNMEFRLTETAPVQARITDVTGKVVSFEDFGTMVQGHQMIQLNTDHLENGFYFVNLKVGEEEISRKISILK